MKVTILSIYQKAMCIRVAMVVTSVGSSVSAPRMSQITVDITNSFCSLSTSTHADQDAREDFVLA